MIKLIASDMDGTLLNGKGGISPYNVEMIKKANAHGVKFVIASGRAYSDILPVIEPHQLKCACVTGNGAEYIDENGNLISSAYLQYEDAISVIDILNQFKIHFMIYTTKGVYSIEPAENVQRAFIERAVVKKKITFEEAYANMNKHHSCFKMIELDDYKTFLKDVSIIKIEAFDVDVSKIDLAKNKFKDLKTVSYLSSFPDNVEITDLKATKGRILLQAIENLGIKTEEVMVLGDSYNDISMFEAFENSVIMDNAPEDIKQMGKYITKSYLEDGVGYAINKWVIKEGKKMIKLIACDVDGTLTDKTGAISEYNVEMIQKAIESGIHFVIASGRDYNDITPLISPYNLKCACITGNGAEYINEEGKIISNAYLPYEQAIQVIEILNKLNIHFMIYTTNGFYSIEAKENVQNEFIECLVKLKKVPYDVAYSVAKKHHSCFKLVELENYKTALKDVSIIKVEAFESNENKINEVKEILKQLKTVSYLSSTPVNLELTNQKATKGKILLETIKNLGINKEEVMVIGDSYNDISMFEIFENSVVMENGPEEVKAMGKYVTKTNLEDGVGYAINKWIFKEVKKDD